MLNKRFFNYGTLGLALATSVFIGCQDFLGEEKGQAAPSSSSDDIQPAAKETQLKDSVAEVPAKTVECAKPVDRVTLCKQLSADVNAQPQSDKEALNKSIAVFNEHDCGAVLDAIRPPSPPIDSALRCKNIETMLVTMDPASPKYPYYQDIVATECAKAVDMPAPVKTVETTPVQPAPAPTVVTLDTLQTCVDVYTKMQTAGEPQYCEFKNKFSLWKCHDVITAAGPGVLPPTPPLDAATQCKMIQNNFAWGVVDSKHPITQAAVDSVCALVLPAKPAVTEPAQPSSPPASTALSPEQEVCKDMWNEMMSMPENYMELKYKYGGMDCDRILGDAKPAPPPFVPPTLEERCRLYRINLTETPPTGDPKYAAHMAEMAITCADYP